MSLPEESNAAVPIQLVRCAAGHYHVPGPCPICDGSAPSPAQPATQALAFPRRRSPLSWLFLFNVIAASLALVAVAVAWVAVFHEPNRPAPAKVEQVAQVQPAAPAPQAPPVQNAQPAPAAAAVPAPAVQTPAAAPEPVAETSVATPLLPAPLPLPRPASAETEMADDPSAPAAPKPAAATAPSQPANPALMAALLPQPPRSSLPLPQRLGVPPGIIQQVRWLDGRTIEILVRALDRQPDETEVIEERPSGDVVRGRLRGGPRPCRFMEIYPAQRSNAFMLVRFCPDAMGRWIGQEVSGY